MIVLFFFLVAATACHSEEECPSYPCEDDQIPCLGDGYCDETCNTADQSWDHGDCCAETCQSREDAYDCDKLCFSCLNPQFRGPRHLKQVEYQGFTLWIDCAERSGVRFRYTLTTDPGSVDRDKNYYRDTRICEATGKRLVPDSCQQKFGTSTLEKYPHKKCKGTRADNNFCFDIGHLVTYNHMDHSISEAVEANYITNVVPQVTGLNYAGGAWRHTERIANCWRNNPNVAYVEVIGGLVFSDATNDYFVESHGIRTPDWFWKVLILHGTENQQDVIAWYMPNTKDAKRGEKSKQLNTYIRSVEELRELVGDPIAEVADWLAAKKPEKSWRTGKRCRKKNPWKPNVL